MKDGLHYYCKICIKKYNDDNKDMNKARAAEYRNRPEVRIKRKICESKRKARKGNHLPFYIEPEKYQELLIKQFNCCFICKLEKPLVIDHDHQTGKVRGLLCNKCNLGLGLLYDDIARLQKAIEYLTLNP